MTRVTLEPHEMAFAAIVGVMRRIKSMNRSQTNKVQNKDFGWHSDIEGACAEMAFAKANNFYWDGSARDRYWNGETNTFKLPDVGGYQIRHTQHLDGRLIVQKTDADDERFVLVVGTSPRFCIVGWILGYEAKQFPLVDPTGTGWKAHFIPQHELSSFEE